jgi:ubiquinone/menaquinone biosynthesis C-methylase UbiE
MMNTLTRTLETERIRASASPPSFLRRIGHHADLELDQTVELLGVKPPSRILETGCGAGLRTTALAARGYRVTGIDPVTWRIAAARGRATDPSLTVSFYKRDAKTFALLDSFDAVIASFPPGQDELDDRRVLLNLAVSLRPGGRLLLDATAGGYTASSITKTLENAGFTAIEVFGSLDRMPYDIHAKRLIAVATR